ncbi:MAG TPA: response regulator [Terriglobia bacterium]|nr:response regulator [Terriglobia bacterium]HVB29250.1 response regulator [Terriglobia bacterium]
MAKTDNNPEARQEAPRILVADDDTISLRVLQRALEKWGHEVVVASDGTKAWQILTMPDAPQLAVLDWMMPGMDGPTICRRIRAVPLSPNPYLILLTARNDYIDIVAGLEAGANDYVTKPFHHAELRARVRVGFRVLDLQNKLADRVRDLETALAQVKQLRGLLPICMYCKKIRKDEDYWQQVESYISDHTEAEFSHGICPECYEKVLKSQLE